MRETWRRLADLLSTRKGAGTLLMTVAASVALGVVPNVLESWTPNVWLLYVAFVIGVTGVLTGWSMTRDRGLGILLALYPTSPSDTRAMAMRNAARDQHAALLVLDRGQLWPSDHTPVMSPEQITLLGRLIDARCAEVLSTGGDLADVGLYSLMSLHDGYRLGQALQPLGGGPAIAHYSPTTEQVVPGIRLHGALRHAPTPASQALAAAALRPPTDPLIIHNPAIGPGHPGHQRLALIVRLAGRDQMISQARHVAETGNPLLPDGRPTGYFFDPDNRTAPTAPCGAVVIVEADGNIPEDPDHFTAITTHIRAQWHTARNTWSAETGIPAEGLLFFNGPLTLAIALGWSLNDAPPTFVAHALPESGGG
ncbi:hypothetical protein ACWDSL_00265 [Streptomyces sp. NPDC000941]